ncbi:unnamed protein product [Heterobilharzia americana]|nr:unnamed protein product [Heterobilharzia americana]
MGKYSSLLQHVDNLLTIYAVPGDKIDRARTYLCLQALEKDLSMLTQAMRTDLENNTDTINTFRRAPNQKHDVFSMRDLVNHSLVGHFVGRTGGRLARLTYLVTSAQAMIGNATGVLKNNLQMNSKGVCSTTIGCGSRDGLIGGYMARIGLCPRLSYVEDTSTACQSAVQRLPFMPLVTLQKDAYGMSVPHFAQPDEIKCISIEAEFVLHLDPPLPISTDAVQQLERITGLSNTEIADHKEKDIVLLILQQHKQEHLYGINTHLQNPNLTQHCYRIQSDVKGYLVSCVPFTCSDQIGEIISILRKQASALAFYETFIVHPDKPVEKDTAMTFTFNIKIMAGQMVSLEFDDPKHFGAEIHASLHVRPFDVQCVEFNHSSYLLSHLNEEEKLVTSKKLKTEAKNNLEANFSRILTKTHTLPIGLAWLLTQLRCPIHKQLENIKLPVNNRYKTQENSSSVSQKQLSSLKAMLNRVKSSIIIRGANGTGGVLCGGDRKASLDFESSSSFAAAQVFALNTPSYLNGSKKIPPLPPGVMATPPPAFSHLDTNSVDLSMMSSLRPMSSQSKFRDIPSNLGLSVISTNPSRGLRLDDLLADSAFQSQQHDQQRNPPSVSLSHPLPSYVSPIPGTHTATTFSDVKDAYSEIISPNTSVSNNSSTNMHSSSQKCSTSILSAPNNFTPSSYNIPSISVTSNSVTSGSLAVTKSKSFTASPMIDSSRAPPTSGSMLVNLLNEESLSSSVPLMSPSSLSDRNLYASTHSLINLQNTSLPSASSIANTPSSRLPGVMSNNLQTTSSDTQFSQGYGKSLSSSAPNLTANTSQCLPVCHSNSITSSAGRPKHSNIKHNQTSLNVGPTGNPKKPRKRRRGTIESGFHCVGNQKVNAPIPCVYTNYPTSKHQRVDAVSSNTTNSLPPTYQRASFNQVNPNLVSCSMPYVQQSVIPPTMQNINMPIPNPSKSVYDFDDTPGSMFDVPVGNISSSNSLSFSSGSSLTSPKSCVPANPLQSSGLTASNPNPVANYPTTTSITSSSNLERTIERKTSLKMTIKTVPSQPITSTPKAGVNFSQNEVDKYNRIQSGQSNSTPTSAIDSGRTTHPTHSLVSTKKRKKRSVEGKPSAYMLQMLQLANSSSVSGSDTSITTTSAVINASEPPTQLTTPFALNNPSLKHVKGANKLVGHGSVLVKKERKRRLGHGFTEKTHFSLIPNSSTFNQLHETSENPSVPKPIKINRLSKPLNADTPKDNQIGPGISTGLYTNPISVSPNSVSSKKKFSTASSTPLVPFIGSGSGSDDMLVAKRLFPSTTSLVNSEKRKRNADALKQSSVSQPNCISSTTSNDAAFTSSPQFIPSNPDSSSNANLSRKTPRSSLHSVTNSSRLPHTSTNRLQSSQQTNTSNYLSNNSACITTNIVSNSTPINVVGASSGLIKGYKIPKKKSMSAECLPNMSLSDVNSDKSSGILSSTIQQIQETLSTFRDTLDSQSPEKSNESSLTIVENLFSSSSDPNIECADRVSVTIYNENINDPENNNSDGSSITSDSLSNFLPNNADSCLQSVSHTVSSQSNISASMQIAQSSQQQLPRKSVKSISDIVDKLRAKSTTSISSVINSANINGSSEIGNSEVTTVTASEVQDSVLSSNLTDHACCIRSIPRKDDESQDQWRDNIFENFVLVEHQLHIRWKMVRMVCVSWILMLT